MGRSATLVLAAALLAVGPGCQSVAGLDRYHFGGGDCSESPCSLVDQCGCDTGEGCYFSAVGTVGECRTAGAAPRGSTCDATASTDTCVPGTSCLGVQLGSSNAAFCLEYCERDDDCTGGSIDGASRCLLEIPGAAGAHWCTSGCNPVGPGGCGDASFSCQIFLGMESGGYATHCIQAGSGAEGDACTEASDCRAGLTCYTADGVCARHCSSSSDCQTGTTCQMALGPVVFDGTSYGICAP